MKIILEEIGNEIFVEIIDEKSKNRCEKFNIEALQIKFMQTQIRAIFYQLTNPFKKYFEIIDEKINEVSKK